MPDKTLSESATEALLAAMKLTDEARVQDLMSRQFTVANINATLRLAEVMALVSIARSLEEWLIRGKA